MAESLVASLKAAVRSGHTESVALLRVLARDYDGKAQRDFVNAQGASEIDIEFPDAVAAVRFAWNMWQAHRAQSDLHDPVSSLWTSVTLTMDVDDETYQRMLANLRAEGKTVCASGAIIAWDTRTTPDPTCLDETQTRTVTEADVPSRGGNEARVSITHYAGRHTSRWSWVSVVLPDGRRRARHVRAEVARRVAERVTSYVDARWGVDSDPRQ